MSGFKLLAIRPLEGCDIRFTRILNHGEIYKFYSEYNFLLSNPKDIHSEVVGIEVSDETSLFNLNDLPVNISAVVGKNGSGKSSLIELLFAAIFVASSSDGILKNNLNQLQDDWNNLDKRRERNERIKGQLRAQQRELKEKIANLKNLNIKNEFTFLTEKFREIQELEEEIEQDESLITHDELEIEFMMHEINRLELDVKVELYYRDGDSFYRLRINHPKKAKKKDTQLIVQHKLIVGKKREKNLWSLLNSENKIDFSKLFYSIAISYSHYGLNSKIIGDWINPLFHKNDGYQTPLVINPMRTKGNIDINIENDLVKQRLLLNILEDIGDLKPSESLRNIAPEKTAFALLLTFDEKKVFSYSERKLRTKTEYPSAKFLNELCLKYVGSNNIGDHGDQIVEGLKIYIGHKLIRICENYDRYRQFIVKGKFNNDSKLIDLIIIDNSHITFKLKQALNFLVLGHFPINDSNKVFQKDLDTFSGYIKSGKDLAKINNKTPSNIELLPPSIFKQTIKLTDGSDLDDLSSGEKQLIHTISSIVYHVINVNSVANNGADKFRLGIKTIQNYKNINILFDEVEQYFHPELQRQFISRLMGYLSRINKNHFINIEGINILLATHSPFILSDIPVSNILRLDNGDSLVNNFNQTFGANIHDLLANDFFLEDGFMGEFAKNEINNVANYLKRESLNHKLSKLKENASENRDLEISRIEIEIKTIEKTEAKYDEKYCKSLIDLVGEPILKFSLMELYTEAFDLKKVDYIQQQIDKLEKMKNQ